MCKTKAFIFVVGCLMVTSISVSAQDAGTVQYLLNYARTYMADGKLISAKNYAKEVLALDPENAEALAILEKMPASSDGLVVDRQSVETGSPADSVRVGELVGSADYFLSYSREYMKAGNLSSAAAYAQDALDIDPNNAEARAIIANANAQKVNLTASGKQDTSRDNKGQFSSTSYLLKYATHHLRNGAYSAAVHYAKQALAIDPSSAEAKRILVLAGGRGHKGASDNSCEAQFSACWAGAKTYSSGSGYTADNARRQQCFVERNLCTARAK